MRQALKTAWKTIRVTKKKWSTTFKMLVMNMPERESYTLDTQSEQSI